MCLFNNNSSINITVFINIENEDKDFIDFNSSFENEKIYFSNNFNDMTISFLQVSEII